MTTVAITEYHCDAGCAETAQTKEKWLPEGWNSVSFGPFGQKPVTHHLCPACVSDMREMFKAAPKNGDGT